MRDGKEIQIRIPMEVNATQIAQKPRRVPYQLTEPLKETPRRATLSSLYQYNKPSLGVHHS